MKDVPSYVLHWMCEAVATDGAFVVDFECPSCLPTGRSSANRSIELTATTSKD